MTSDNSKPAADEQLLSLDELRDLWNAQADAANSWDALGADEIVWWAQRQALARAGLADGPAVPEGREPAAVVGEPSDMELLATLEKATAAFPPRHPKAEALNAVEYPLALELRKARVVLARWGHQPAPPAEGATGDAAVEAAAELIYNQAMKWAAAAQPIPSDRIHIPAWQQGGNSDAQEVARRTARAVLARFGNHSPDATKIVGPGPSIEAVGSLIAWLSEQACQAADAGQPTDAGMLTWAAQVIGERVDEDAPAPPAEGEVGELAAWLRMQGEAQKPGPNSLLSDRTKKERHAAGVKLTRAADLVEQRHPAPPAEGDVAELVAWLRGANWDSKRQTLATRAADLLEQFSSGWVVPTVEQFAPVPVSERLPGPGDCDAEGRCWLLTVEDEYPQWRLHSIEGNQPGGSTMIWVPVDSSPGVMVDAFYASHWLPATALPLPKG